MKKILTLLTVGAIFMAVTANAQGSANFEWWVEQHDDSNSYTIIVDASQLQRNREIVKAVCEVVFRNSEGHAISSESIEVPAPIASGGRRTKTDAVPDGVDLVEGKMITAQVRRLIVGITPEEVEIVRQPPKGRDTDL